MNADSLRFDLPAGRPDEWTAVEDVPAVKALLDDHRDIFGFGFVERARLEAELLDQIIGFIHYRTRRRDEPGLKVVYRVCVAPEYRGWGVGRMLVEAVGRPVRLKCPPCLEANGFYAALGFRLVDEGGLLNVWRHD